MLNPIFWKIVQGQKHPGRWETAEHQIPSLKMLFETKTKGHNHPSIRIFITEENTIGKPKKTESVDMLASIDTGLTNRGRDKLAAMPQTTWIAYSNCN